MLCSNHCKANGLDSMSPANDRKPSTRYVNEYKHRHETWKKSRKHQYRGENHFDLYQPYEVDACGIVITDKELDDLYYIWSTYRPLLFPHLIPVLHR